MNDAPIVSHVASPEYRQHIDDMTCAEPGCRRWRMDGSVKVCADHFKSILGDHFKGELEAMFRVKKP